MYKLYKTDTSLSEPNAAFYKQGDTMISFLFDENNREYKKYLEWLEEGNTPEPADE